MPPAACIPVQLPGAAAMSVPRRAGRAADQPSPDIMFNSVCQVVPAAEQGHLLQGNLPHLDYVPLCSVCCNGNLWSLIRISGRKARIQESWLLDLRSDAAGHMPDKPRAWPGSDAASVQKRLTVL